MRIIYFLLKIFLQFAFRIFFPRIKLIRAPKHFFGRTIYVSNHASSFLDPVLIGVLQRPIVFFMTRSDVFLPVLKPITWASHMLPIYREHDGEDTKARNEEVFKKCTRILYYGRNLLVFGEGFTDDTFIRRLKPVKKGAIRIGFKTLEEIGWKKKIYIAALGVNYGDPNHFGSDLLISNSERICLNDYREDFERNPAKTTIELTRRVEKMLQNQLTHIADKNWTDFHEGVSRLRRNGMNPVDSDKSIPLKQRWENSRRLAKWMNEQELETNSELVTLKEKMNSYFKELRERKIEEKYIYELAVKGKLEVSRESFQLILTCVFIPLGLIHFYVPYSYVKRFVEKTFKRKVFWSSVKITMGTLLMALWNIPMVYLLDVFIFHNGIIAWAYYLLLPLIGWITYLWFQKLRDYRIKKELQKSDLSSLLQKRTELIEKIGEIIPN